MKRTLVLTLICTLPSALWAGGTSYWTHTNEADFKQGRFQNVVATNLGDVKLSRAVKTLLEQDPRVSTVYALVEAPDGTVYAGTGPQGIVLQLSGEKISTCLTLDDQNVFSLLVDKDGRLLMGTGGEKGRILRMDKPGEKPTEVFTEEGVQYIWQMRQLPDGTIYAATGPNGQIFQINTDGTHSVLFKSDENNILSLVTDAKDTLYAGTDPNGLVYRINRKTKDVFVLFDAPESEIRALVLDAKGDLYAGTAEASEGEQNGADEAGMAEKTGRPEGGEAVTPLPSPVPKEPEPPPVPKPNPGEPDPIPKAKPNLLVLDPALAVQFDDTAEGPTTRNHPAAPTPGPGPSPSPGPGGPPVGGHRAMPAPATGKVQMPPGFPGASPAETNAIYKIDADGFVTEVFRNPAMILSLIENNGVLLAGTGSEGLVYQLNPAADETVELAKVDPKQVMSLLATKDGRMILGLANVGGLASMTSGYATEGTFTSPVLDAGQISRFGKIHLVGSLPAGSTLTLATRSGNLEEAGDTGWSKWSSEIPAAEYVQVTSSPARFLQYRLTLTSTEGKTTPVVDEVDVAYRMPNLPPQVKSVKIVAVPEGDSPRPPVMMIPPGAAATPAPKDRATGRNRILTWETADPNNESLEYSIHFRAGMQGAWILLQDKIKEPQFLWDTRGVPDGRYQLRVTASDAKSNPPGEGKTASRVSDPVVVDNTPPVIGDLKTTVAARQVRIEAKLVDRTSTVASFEYALDSKDDWQTVAALDSIFDSPEEAVSFLVDGLSAGAHEIMLRASDDHGNQAYEAVHVTIAAPGK